MSNEFNLSNEIISDGFFNVENQHVLFVKDVKEFIRRLKDNLLRRHAREMILNYDEFEMEIDKLAGEKLI